MNNPAFALLALLALLPQAAFIQYAIAQGSWQLLLDNAGIAAMHAAVTRFNTVILLDRTNIGASQIDLPNGECRRQPSDLKLKIDCTAHSVLFNPADNTVRPLFVQTDTWCSSGQFIADGTLVQTGGDFDGFHKVRTFSPCPARKSCNWVESSAEVLQDGRWYATNQLLPDGKTQIVIGGRLVNSYEFIPSSGPKVNLPFLQKTNDAQYDNLYPFVYLLPDGNLYIFANRDSIILNYRTHEVVKTFPTIPGEPRNYPSGGSSVMLPLRASDGYSKVEVLICGGAQYGAYLKASSFPTASDTCGRIVVTDNHPIWDMQKMPYPRAMGDMVQLPTGDVLIINGAQNGCQGWGKQRNAILTPLVYSPATAKFSVQTPSRIPRVYHSTASLLQDGRVLIAGSNSHQYYTFRGEFPTELRIEAFSPQYMKPAYNSRRPSIVDAPASVGYNTKFKVTIALQSDPSGYVGLSLLSVPFTTHSYSQGQRMLSLEAELPVDLGEGHYAVTAKSPPYATLAPPSYYMLFAVNDGIAGAATWLHIS